MMRVIGRYGIIRTLTSTTILISTTRGFASSSILNTATTTASSNTMAAATNKINIPTKQNLVAISNLEPKSLWEQFAILSSIPRPSKQETAVLEYIKSFADERNLHYKQDHVGNLCVFRPGSGNGVGKNAPPVIIQGHVDMVTEKNSDSNHNFETDPIRLVKHHVVGSKGEGAKEVDEVWLGADGTTLGADNGIGVAAALALLDMPLDDDKNSKPMPPIEALFTVDEETGLTGAMDLNVDELGMKGKIMLNLDTEEWGELYVGCAGGGESILTFPVKRSSSRDDNNYNLVELRVDGLMGGHSGINIHEGRANAIVLCAAAAHAALLQASSTETESEARSVRLVSLVGGDKHNAIPREATALLAISNNAPEAARQAVQEAVKKCAAAAVAEYGLLETKLRMELIDYEKEPSSTSCGSVTPLDHSSATRLLSMLLALPHGPLKFSHSMKDLVETSNNIASISMSNNNDGDDSADDTATILCSTRSSIGTAMESTRDKIAAIASLAGASVERTDAYPGWNPNLSSPLLGLAKSLLQERYGAGGQDATTVGVKAIHAGLECGLLIDKLGGSCDVISFGPTIVGAHSPDERINTDTVLPFFNLVQDILEELALSSSKR